MYIENRILGGGVRMLKKIYQELILIRKELQAIRSSKESTKNTKEYNPNTMLGNKPIR